MLNSLKLSILWATVAALAVMVSSEVISDFCAQIDEIEPCEMETGLQVSFGKCGTRLSPRKAGNSPSVVYNDAAADQKYLIVMVDPDAPSRDNPIYRYWRHWVVADIAGRSLKRGIIEGKTLSEYIGPSPPHKSGPHRYQIFLFSYPRKLKSEKVLNDKQRGTWDVVNFIRHNDLCRSLVAGYEFFSEN